MATFKSGEVMFNGDGTANFTVYDRQGRLDFNSQEIYQNYIFIKAFYLPTVVNQNDSWVGKIKRYAYSPQKPNYLYAVIYYNGKPDIGKRGYNIDLGGIDALVVENNKITSVKHGYESTYNIFNGELTNTNPSASTDNSSTIQNDTTAASNDTVQTPSSTASNSGTTQNTQSATASTQQYKYVARKYNEISQIQQILKDKGFYSDKIDGQVGPKTAAALLKYVQSKEGANTVQNNTAQNAQTQQGTAPYAQVNPTNPELANSTQLKEVREFYDLLDRMKDVF